MKKLVSILKDNRLSRLLARYSADQYRPEKHYMRGPGPKALEKADGRPLSDTSFAKTSRTRRS